MLGVEAVYKIKPDGIENMIERFLTAPTLEFEHREEIWRALRHARVGTLDFVDALIGAISESHGCDYILTFDQKAAKCGIFKAA